MISDEELAQLPEDPTLAFVEFERILRAHVDEQELQAFKLADEGVVVPHSYSLSSHKREYINKVLAAAKAYEITALQNWSVPSAQDEVDDVYINFTADVDHFTTQVRIRNAPRNRQNSVGLDGNTKAKIHHHIEQIKTAIEKAALPEPKRDSLYDKLNRFAAEVDRARTNLQAGMAVYIEVCDGIGQGFKKLEPARKWVDSIAALLGRAKADEDSLRPMLPRPQERKQLEAPRARIEGPPAKQQTTQSGPTWDAPTGGDLDDEIPF
jgi:hypothetical protein